MQFNNLLFRASSNGKLMVKPRAKSEVLSETTKTYLLECYISEKYGRQKEITSKYLEKGLQCEDDSITVYSRVKKEFYKKNDQRLKNDFICGTPDLFIGEDILTSHTVIETKTSWSLYTFFDSKTKELNDMYYWQVQSYMALTGAKESRVAFCLINTPETLINDEKRKLLYKMNAGTEENPDYIEACTELDKMMKYDDIPLRERMFEFTVDRNDDDILRLYDKIKLCRKYLNALGSGFNDDISAVILEYKPELSATIVENA